ncbi:hypothetical protein T11_17385 [Trichinella zimbabwensis]|uniref:Uncharacterized protein n=1 Tax=Trichinella zimbabwensis TaxID=268475 RepID=A0A0V1HE12_9BILA|nr:hypothetical protein T11_17385 [Trichinella zimbabwensis]
MHASDDQAYRTVVVGVGRSLRTLIAHTPLVASRRSKLAITTAFRRRRDAISKDKCDMVVGLLQLRFVGN